MTSNHAVPDYDLPDRLELTSAQQVRAISNPLRTVILGLLHERAATVTEIASAVGRPKSTVAYHVNLLHEAGLVRVVRTRRVRAIEERSFGRTARMFHVGVGVGSSSAGGSGAPATGWNDLDVAAGESRDAARDDHLWSFIRHARIPPDRASEFWTKALALVDEFDGLARSGPATYGFVVGLFPIPDYPALPEPADPREA